MPLQAALNVRLKYILDNLSEEAAPSVQLRVTRPKKLDCTSESLSDSSVRISFVSLAAVPVAFPLSDTDQLPFETVLPFTAARE